MDQGSKLMVWQRLLLMLVATLLLVLTGLAIWCPYDLRGIETNVVYTLQTIIDSNANLYRDPAAAPFSITQYGPLYYVIVDGANELLGVNPSHPYTVMVTGRVMSSVFLLGVVVLLYDELRGCMQVSRWSCYLLLLLLGVHLFPWGNLVRPDGLLVLLFTVLLRLSLHDRKTATTYLVVGGCIALGVATKLTFVAYGGLYGVYLLYHRRWRDAVLTTVGAIVVMLGLAVLLPLAGYDLGYLWENTIEGIDNGSDLRWATEKVYYPLFIYLGPLLGVALVQRAYGNRLRRTEAMLLAYWLVCTLAVCLLTALKYGSAENYYDEFTVVVVLYIGAQLRSLPPDLHRVLVVVYLLLLIQITGVRLRTYLPAFLVTAYQEVTGADEVLESYRREVTTLLKSDGANKVYVSDRLLGLRLYDHSVLFQSDIHDLSYPRGTINYTNFHRFVREGRLTHLVMDQPTDSLYGVSVSEYYQPRHTIGSYLIYTLH